MPENRLGIGRISFPQDTNTNLLRSLEELVRKIDDNVNYLLKPSVEVAATTYTATDLDYTILGNGTFTVNLPDAATVTGKILIVKNIGSGTITIDGYDSQTIDGATTEGLATQYDSRIIQSDGSNWYVLANK